MSEPRRLAIIGGGASAALLLLHLARFEKTGGYAVDVFDRSSRFFRGVAYDTDYNIHRLNVRAANMSAYADDPDDFARWAARFQYGPDDFVSRPLYAKYLEERLRETITDTHVRLISDDVLSSRRANDDLYAVSGTQIHSAYHAVVQASGNVRLIQPARGEGVRGYVAEPWHEEAYANLPGAGSRIVLLGSGLSAIDAISGLKMQDYKGRITVVSRNGWFPCTHAAPAKYAPFLGPEEASLPPSQLMRRVRDEIEKAMRNGTPWQAVIDSLRGMTNTIWQGWDDNRRAVFLRRAFTAWNIHRHRTSPESLQGLEEFRADGQLEIVRDSIVRIDAPLNLVCRGQTIAADRIINCLGYRYDEGRDFEVSHKIGPARFGELFETTAIPEIRTQAADVAAALAAAV